MSFNDSDEIANGALNVLNTMMCVENLTLIGSNFTDLNLFTLSLKGIKALSI